MIAPTPGRCDSDACHARSKERDFPPMVSMVSPVAWTIPFESWSTICKPELVIVMTKMKRPGFDGDSRYLIPISRLLSLGTA
ncbi:Hypothetical protein PFR_JS12-1_508 [Propionibacterium freudenreichii]|nr:Hypothetical protein PFR_JS12-2_508 [Propionibacterium freudenreichii]SCC96476.1 Hypothetical protein PFR_JS12-1_508 [Propionibacterium freudenreichii]